MYKISVTNEYISPKEAAERLAVSTGTVRRLMKGGDLAAYRFGKQIRITVQSLEEYINRQKIIISHDSEIKEPFIRKD